MCLDSKKLDMMCRQLDFVSFVIKLLPPKPHCFVVLRDAIQATVYNINSFRSLSKKDLFTNTYGIGHDMIKRKNKERKKLNLIGL